MDATLSLGQIGQIALSVHDLEKAVRFYRDVLGMRFLYEYPGLAFFDCAGVRLMLSRPETAEFDRPGSVIYFRVADLPTVFETLTQRGVEFVEKPNLVAHMPDHDLWIAVFRDLDGNNLALMSEVPLH